MKLFILAIICVIGLSQQVLGNSISSTDLQYGSRSVCNRRDCDVSSGVPYTLTFSYRVDKTMSSKDLKWTATVGKSSWFSGNSMFKNYNLCQSGGGYVLQSGGCSEFTLQQSSRLQIYVYSVYVPAEKESTNKDLYLTDGYEKASRIIGLNIKS